MNRFVGLSVLLASASTVWAQTPPPEGAPADDAPSVQPAQPAPNLAPPALPANPGDPDVAAAAPATPPPPQVAQPAPAAPPPADGQWIYTQQYGWIWQPYAQAYTRVAPDVSSAFVFVWRPAFGWHWVAAPWVVGWGPRPWWGPLGPHRFVWYARPWYHRPYYGRPHYGYGYRTRVIVAPPHYGHGGRGGWHHRH